VPKPIRILLFSTARTVVGRAELAWTVPSEGTPAATIARDLARTYPALARTLSASRLVRNGRYLRSPTERVRPGDELAIHPPYGGG
jgi:molybdopterin converting factor small subunit